MFYDRQVKYLNYYEEGEKLKGSGFLKLEVRDKVLRWEISVKGLRDISGRFPILFVGEMEAVVAELELKQGNGNLRHECRIENDIASTGITYNQWKGVRVPLTEGKEISCYWEPYGASEHKEERIYAAEHRMELTDKEESQASVAGNAMWNSGEEEPEVSVRGRTAQIAGERVESEEAAKGKAHQIAEEKEEQNVPAEGKTVQTVDEKTEVPVPVLKKSAQTVKQERPDARRGIMSKGGLQEGMALRSGEGVRRDRREQNPVRGQLSSEKNLSETWREDKWSQLCAIYPHISPFRDEREYLSISPADFVLFPERDYKAVHNSFLLHGYYNYKHLILARMEQRGEILYYVGVPGNYCEREKQVAVMFRFESFECASEPAEYGDFGYYMMRVNL